MYLFSVYVFWLQKCRFERLEVRQTCIYSKRTTCWCQKCTTPAYTPKSKVLIVKSHQTIYTQKNQKNNQNLRLYVGPTGIHDLVFDFFDFFEYMQVWWLFTIKTFDFLEYMQALCIFGIKMLFFLCMQVWWTSSPSNLHILKKVKHFDREKSPNLHILKKNQKNQKLSPNLWFSWVYAGFVHFWHQNVVFLSICRLCAL